MDEIDNPIIQKYMSLPEDSKKAWLRGFLDAAKHVRFVNWTQSQVDEAIKIFAKI